jgi:hypothetical protein
MVGAAQNGALPVLAQTGTTETSLFGPHPLVFPDMSADEAG